MKLKFGDKPFGEIEDRQLRVPKPKRISPVEGIITTIQNAYLHEDDIKRLIKAVWYRAQQGVCHDCQKKKDKQGGRLVFVCKECHDSDQEKQDSGHKDVRLHKGVKRTAPRKLAPAPRRRAQGTRVLRRKAG